MIDVPRRRSQRGIARPALLLAVMLAIAADCAWSRTSARDAKPRAARAAATAAPPSVVPERGPRTQDLREIRLANGLRIFVRERHASPTFAAYYQFGVGSAMDPKGASGIAHLLEHMMFKGTRTLGTTDYGSEAPLLAEISAAWHELHEELDAKADPFRAANEPRIAELTARIEALSARQKDLVVKNEFDEIMTRAGGVSENASTSNDVTNYFIELPANRLELWFMLESDRLLHPVFREFYSERDVVHEERRLSENSAEGRAWEALESLVFSAHPYGTPVVGWPADISRLGAEHALAYFETYYSPTNCVVVLVGDVDPAEVERLAERYFGRWKPQRLPRLHVTSEPEQAGERRRVVEFDAQPQVMMAWPAAASGTKDAAALQLLGSVLGGLASSRFERKLVQEEKLATGVWSYADARRRGGAFMVGGIPAPGRSVAELEDGIGREIRRLQADGITAEELERAKVQVEVQRVGSLDDNLGQAFQIGWAVGLSGVPGWVDEAERRLLAVTTTDVQGVAARYLTPSRRNVVEVRKVASSVEEAEPGEARVEHQRGGSPGDRGAKHSAGYRAAMKLVDAAPPVEMKIPEVGRDVTRVELPCGAVVFLKEDRVAPRVQVSFSWKGGSNTAPLEELPAYEFASGLLSEGGTESLDPMALAERKEQLGMRFWIGTGGTSCSASFWSLSRTFPEAFDLALEMLTRPRLDADRLAVQKGQYVDQMRRRPDYPSWAVALLESHVLHGDHPRLGFQPSRAQVDAVRPDDVRRIWRRHYGRDNLHVTVVGDFVAADMLRTLEQRLCALRKAEDSRRDWLTRAPSIRPGVYLMEKDVPSPSVSITHEMAVDRTASPEEHAALEILNDVLGGSGFRSRLMERLRSDEGLTYGIYSGLSHEGRPGVPGSFSVGYETKAASVAESVDSVLEEIGRVVRERVSQAEVREQVESWRNRFIFQFENEFYSTRRLMSHELDDRPFDRDVQVLRAIEKVTVDDVLKAAEKHLRPESLTISIYGTLTEEDRRKLAERFTVKDLSRDEVFRGGYDDEPRSMSREPARSARGVQVRRLEALVRRHSQEGAGEVDDLSPATQSHSKLASGEGLPER